jgi:hypothetical protein
MTAAFDKSELEHQADVISARLTETMSLDPMLIFTILTQVLPLLMNCGVKNASPKPEDIRDMVTERYNKGGKSRENLRRSIARRVRGESDQPITKEESLQMADAIIQETMFPTSDDNALARLVAECASLDPTV